MFLSLNLHPKREQMGYRLGGGELVTFPSDFIWRSQYLPSREGSAGREQSQRRLLGILCAAPQSCYG